MERKRSKNSVSLVEEPIATIVLFAETVDKIRSLYTMIDTDSDGVLTIDDFDAHFVSQAEAKEKWDSIRAHFDQDADGHVDLNEFLGGFKKLTLSETSFFPSVDIISLADLISEVEKEVNERCCKIVDELYEFLSN
eukprot:m.5418 g.5418  ORF g.5418 m.5418 type:complete len:136 (+) comp2401_c0_seq1:171-578(+)